MLPMLKTHLGKYGERVNDNDWPFHRQSITVKRWAEFFWPTSEQFNHGVTHLTARGRASSQATWQNIGKRQKIQVLALRNDSTYLTYERHLTYKFFRIPEQILPLCQE